MPGKSPILIVEDDTRLARLLAFLLRSQAKTVRLAGRVDEAQVAMETAPRPFRLIVLDRMLPDQDGHVLLSWIRHHPELRVTPVLMLSALGQPDARAAGLRAGADAYLAKPFEPAALIAEARRLMNA